MLFALDRNCNRIHIDATVKGEDYFCPCCESRLVLKKGTERIHHFAHPANSFCMDSWHYDMTEWHLDWQNKFPKECQEIVKEKDGQKHRADVLIEEAKVVFEFQHSQLSPTEFEERNSFYNDLGYTVVWVFDVEEQYQNDQIENYEDNKWSWKGSKKSVFAYFNAKDKKTEVYLQLDNDEPLLVKITWNVQGKGLYRFATSGHYFSDDDLINQFFPQKEEGKKDYRLSDLYDRMVLLNAKDHTTYYFGCPISSTHKCANCIIDIPESKYSEIMPCEKCEFYDRASNNEYGTTLCKKRFLDLGLDENNVVQIEEKDEFGFINKISYVEKGERKEKAIPTFDIQMHLKNVFDLWKENECRIATFRNVKRGEYVRITQDPLVQLDKYGKVYGYLSDNQYKFPPKSTELWYLDKQVWTLVWNPQK